MKTNSWCVTDRGLRRDSNQDSFLINHDLGLYIVADGMGGHSGGEVASSIAVSVAEQVLLQNRRTKKSPRDLIVQVYEEASRQIFDMAMHKRPELAGMGTTMVVALVTQQNIYIGNVGDSRCYLYKATNLWQITEDHSLINEQVRSGALSYEQAKVQTARNVITRSVGYERSVTCDVYERQLAPGEIYLLCSDGLSSLVSDSVIRSIIQNQNPSSIAQKCVDEALAHGGDDNVTVLVLEVT